MHYDDLDPTAQYKIRVVYAGDGPQKKIRCVANGTIEVHPADRQKKSRTARWSSTFPPRRRARAS